MYQNLDFSENAPHVRGILQIATRILAIVPVPFVCYPGPMQTRREALIAAGLAKPGRGKFSTAANAWLESQRSNGVKFSDDNAPVRTITPRASVKSTGVPSKESSTGISDYIFPSDFRFPESEYRAVVSKDAPFKPGMRDICNTCRVSLTVHTCDSPVVYGNIPVTIERR